MVMFDPQYVRPDDVGTQRNKALILTETESLQAVSEVSPRPGDKSGGDTVMPVAYDRRKQAVRDRRQGRERRQQELACLLDTRSHRERRSHLRRRDDTLVSEEGASPSTTRQGIDVVI